MGAGELACTLGMLCISTSPELLLLLWLLLSLLIGCVPFSLFSLLLLPSAETGPEAGTPASGVTSTGLGFGGAVHREISQWTPVKVLSWKPPLVHFRHGLPERSRARRPALMAPWFALGPSRCAAGRGSRVPSSLRLCQCCVSAVMVIVWCTHIRCLFLGPGFPRILLAASPFTAAADLLTPFFFGPWPSPGGPITDGTGVLPLAGVAGFESEAFSGIEAAAAWRDADSAEGESLASFMGVSSLGLCEVGSRRVRSLSDETLRVTSREAALEDLRRSFAVPAVLMDGAIA